MYHTFTRWLDVTLPQASIEILTFHLDPTGAIIMLAAIYYG